MTRHTMVCGPVPRHQHRIAAAPLARETSLSPAPHRPRGDVALPLYPHRAQALSRGPAPHRAGGRCQLSPGTPFEQEKDFALSPAPLIDQKGFRAPLDTHNFRLSPLLHIRRRPSFSHMLMPLDGLSKIRDFRDRQRGMVMSDWQQLFVGREAELATLRQCWAKVQAGTPQLAVLLAPPGMGKTRLVQEFYHHVSATHDGAGENGYWPDRLGRERDRFALNCSPEECNPARPMTLLWWAIKCVDNGSNTAASSDLQLAYSQNLKPHLEIRRTTEQLAALRREQVKEGAKGFADIGIAVAEKGAEAIPVVGPFIGLGKAIGTAIVGKSRRIAELEKQRFDLEAGQRDLSGKSAAIERDFEDQLLYALGHFTAPASPDLPRCPLIIIVDDAQFADQDISLRSFLRRFIDTAWEKQWPVFVVLTHWTHEWNLHLGDVDRLPGLIDRAVSAGYMDATVIEPGRIDELGVVLTAAIPDMPEDQRQALLRKAGGNGRYLDRLIQLLLSSPAMFVAREASGTLHQDALDEVMREGFDLHDVTRRLFDIAPEAARRAAALASLQGERFLHDVIEDVAKRLDLPPMAEGLGYCASPMRVIGDSGPGVGEFSQGVFREVARSLVSRAIDRESVVTEALVALCKQRLDDWEDEWNHVRLVVSQNSLSDLLFLDFAIGLINGGCEEQEARGMLAKALLFKGRVLVFGFGDHFGARPLLERGLAISQQLANELGTPDLRRRLGIVESMLGHVVSQIEGAAAARPHYERCVTIRQRLVDDFGTPDLRHELGNAEGQLGEILLKAGELAAARPHCERYLTMMQKLADEIGSLELRRELGVAEDRMGSMLLSAGELAAAKPHFKRQLAITQSLIDEHSTPQLKFDLAIAEFQLGGLLFQALDFVPAQNHVERSLSIIQQLVDENVFVGTGVHRDLAMSEYALGEVILMSHGDTSALHHFERSLAIIEKLADESGTPELKRMRLFMKLKTEELRARIGPVMYQPDTDRFQDRSQDHFVKPPTSASRGEPRVSDGELDDLILQIEDLAKVQTPPKHNQMSSDRVPVDPGSPECRSQVLAALRNLSELLWMIEDPLAARPYLQRFVAICDQLTGEMATPEILQMLEWTESRLGDIMLQIDGWEAARPVYNRYIAVVRLQADAGTVEIRRKLGVAENWMGDMLLETEGPSAALPYFEQSLVIRQRLANELSTLSALKELEEVEVKLRSLGSDRP